jgi:glycosyltransferase involved in cell wall biosynthesis
MLHSNFGAERFEKIRDSLSLWQKVKINLRAAVSIAGIRKADNIFVLSEYAKKEKMDLFKVDSHVVCGAISQQDIGLVPEIEISKYKDYEYVVLTIARLDINKRIDVLIKSFALFLEKKPNSVLVIGGTGPEKESLISLAKQIGIGDNVDFIGFIPEEELYSYYAAADLFASIDWADYRITAYESLAVGTKVLLSNETDFGKDLVDSGYLRFSKPNVEETSVAIEAMLNSKPSRDTAWLNKYLEQVTWPTFCRKLMDYLTWEA